MLKKGEIETERKEGNRFVGFIPPSPVSLRDCSLSWGIKT